MRRSTTPLLALAACLLAFVALPAGATANAMDDRIAKDCQNSQTGALTGSYTKAQLRHARNNLPGDVLEYSGCWDAIQQALRATASGDGANGGGTGGDGGFGSSPGGGIGGTSGSGVDGGGAPGGDPSAPAPAPHTGTEAPVAIAGTTIQPGRLPSVGQDANALPDPLLALLVLLGLAALAPVALTIGRRVVARRRA
jgi:hypothetical protein